MKCESIHKLVCLAHSREISGEERFALEKHLEQCSSCREYSEEFTLVTERARANLRAGDVSEDIVFGIRQMAAARLHSKADTGSKGGLSRIIPGSYSGGFFYCFKRYSMAAAATIVVLAGIWAFIAGSRDNGPGASAVLPEENVPAGRDDYATTEVVDFETLVLFPDVIFSTAGDDLFEAITVSENISEVTLIDREILLLDGYAI